MLLYAVLLAIVIFIGSLAVSTYRKPALFYRGDREEPSEKYIKGAKKQATMLMVMCGFLVVYIIYAMIAVA